MGWWVVGWWALALIDAGPRAGGFSCSSVLDFGFWSECISSEVGRSGEVLGVVRKVWGIEIM